MSTGRKTEFVVDAIIERKVLGGAIAMARKDRAPLVRLVAPDEFFVKEHPPIWRGFVKMEQLGLEYDPDIMRRLIEETGMPVPEEYLTGLEAEAIIPENLPYLVEKMRWDATRARALQGVVPELMDTMRTPDADPEKVVSQARAIVRALEGGSGRSFIRRPEELKRAYKAEMAARMAVSHFYPSGWPAMDEKLVEGFMPKLTGVTVGLSGAGKSTLVANLVLNLAKQQQPKRRVLYCPWEMGVEGMIDVLVCIMTGLTKRQVKAGRRGDQVLLTPEEYQRICNATDWICDRIKFMDNPFYAKQEGEKGGRYRPSNERNLDTLEGYIAESGCDVVIMDLWERALVDLSYDGVTTALYRQQDMHKRYNVFGMIVHQLKGKDVEKRADKRPTREAIKGTGAFVEVADLILGVHREGYIKKVPDTSQEVICLKQRNGEPNWAVRFEWNGAVGKITGGKEVPYDPSADTGSPFVGDIGDLKTRRGRRNEERT